MRCPTMNGALPRLLAQPNRTYQDTQSQKLISVSDMDDVVTVLLAYAGINRA